MAIATIIGQQPTTENYVASGVIASGASLSDTFKPGGRTFIKIEVPEITSATLSFQVQSYYDGAFQDLYDDAGNEVTVGSAFTAARTFLAPSLSTYYAFKIRSGTTGTPVNQGAERTFVVVATRGSRIA
jgi:hypothetical protein